MAEAYTQQNPNPWKAAIDMMHIMNLILIVQKVNRYPVLDTNFKIFLI